ncbi:M23 family metallopeptidase [Microbulbifer sp. 2304DJ12-6]|uniref:M23 family metallopeptidase n=1 Tax=Microbulbifer sp. 2304DJ12-6 TaxID=3233340 RepID=UPI0039AF0120
MKKLGLGILTFLMIGFMVPEPMVIPVEGATESDWNPVSFWYEPWGSSGVHKGLDIFSKKGVSVLSSTNLLVVYRGETERGGNILVGIGPKWRIHYFAHLDAIEEQVGLVVAANERIGTVGNTGNAKGKLPHVHYSILSLLPMFWRVDLSTQGYKKAVYINPAKYLAG